MACAQIVSEPAHDEGHAPQVRAQSEQMGDRSVDIGDAVQLMPVFSDADTGFRLLIHQGRLIDELARARDQRDGADHLVEARHRSHHLEGELRHAIAIAGERKALEHDIGDAAIGRRLAGFLGGDQRIELLILEAAMDAQRDRVEIDFAAIGPDAAHESDRPSQMATARFA